MTHIAVVGGGIAGLAAAVRLAERSGAGTQITVYEGSDSLGGKLRTGTVGGARVDLGAEAFLTRDPAGGDSAAVELARRVGLGDALVHPVTTRAAVAVDGALHPLPAGTLMGVPADPASVAPLARPAADLDHDGGRPLLGPDDDVAIGALVRRRLGDEVVDRLVEPMLGGVYAGRADDLSLAATAPALARACRTAHTLTGAVKQVIGRPAAPATSPPPAPAAPAAPVFTTVAGGLGRLVDAAAAAVADRVRFARGLPVRELHRAADGWRLVIGATRDPRTESADAVVLAVPARPAGRLLAGVAADAAATVGELDYASVAMVTFALPADTALPDLSGLLVPVDQGTAVKAATFFTTKWGHLRTGPDAPVLVRASLGRYGEERTLQRADDDLVRLAHAELSRLIGRRLPDPLDTHLQRWGGALPQYRPGHLDRVAAARAALAADHPTLALAGAGYDGVGIPICIRSGQTAADHVLTALGEHRD